jgi:hypothetical protein
MSYINILLFIKSCKFSNIFSASSSHITKVVIFFSLNNDLYLISSFSHISSDVKLVLYEFGISLSIGYVKLDYFIKELNLVIEYNGNKFHANPKLFNSNDCPNPYNTNLTSEEIWEKDDIRYKSLFNEKNITTLVIWEDEAENILENLQDFINNKILIYDI